MDSTSTLSQRDHVCLNFRMARHPPDEMLDLAREKRLRHVYAHFFSSAGQFIKRLIDEVFVRSAVSTAKRWPSALTS